MSDDVPEDVPEDVPAESSPSNRRLKRLAASPKNWMQRAPAGVALPVVLGAALVLTGVGALLISNAYGGSPHIEAPGTAFAINAGAGDLRDINAHNSPSVVRSPRDPSQLAVSNRIDTPAYSCALHVSTDGGVRWRPVALAVPRGEEPKCYAPDVAYGADGTLYVSYVTLRGLGNVPHAVWVVSSKDGGRTLSRPVRAISGLAFQVRLQADPTVPGLIYLTYLKAEEVGLYRFSQDGNPIEAQRSPDGGATWTTPVRVSDPRRARALAPSPAMGPHGELYVTYLDLGEDKLDYEGLHKGRGGPPYQGTWSLIFARSRDRGTTWEETTIASKIVPTTRFIAFIPPVPSLAVDRDGRHVYATYTDGSLGDPDVRLWRSSDGGGRWTAIRVNDTPEPDGHAQYLPQVAVAPDGRVDVVYYDRRDDGPNVRNDVSLQSSFDHAQSFGPHVRLNANSFDSGIGQGSNVGLADLGSRLALLSTDAHALAIWPDTNAGTQASGKQDLRRAVADVVTPARLAGGLTDLLRFGGLLLVVLGLVLVGRWALAQKASGEDEPPPASRGRDKDKGEAQPV